MMLIIHTVDVRPAAEVPPLGNAAVLLLLKAFVCSAGKTALCRVRTTHTGSCMYMTEGTRGAAGGGGGPVSTWKTQRFDHVVLQKGRFFFALILNVFLKITSVIFTGRGRNQNVPVMRARTCPEALQSQAYFSS